MEFKILKAFRENPNPKLSHMGDKLISAFKKEELLECAKERFQIDMLELCRVGGLDPNQETIVKLVQHTIDVKKTAEKRPANEQGQEPGNMVKTKKVKENPSATQFDELCGKIGELEKKLAEKRTDDEKFEFERLKRETKGAALGEVKPEEIFAKLVLLDNMARTVKDPHREQISMLISRFNAHRNQPKFAAALVVKLLSSKEEELVLDKEQKMLKSFGLGSRDNQDGAKSYQSQFPQACFSLKKWEEHVQLGFNPAVQVIRKPSFTSMTGDAIFDQTSAFSAEEAFMLGSVPDISNLRFPSNNDFVSGQLHNNVKGWEHIVNMSTGSDDAMSWVREGVDLEGYFVPFKGTFWGVAYDCASPPPRVFNNSNKCKGFVTFINETIKERLQNGSIKYVGPVGASKPPYLVAPLTVEETKPRLCLNLMYLNCWTRQEKFSLDTLRDVPRATEQDAYFTSIDDKSAFDGLRLKPSSQKWVGFQWAGHFFHFVTLPFGYKLSSYIYHTLNLQPTIYFRKVFNIPIFLYIDDRLIESVRKNYDNLGSERALMANFLVCEVLIRLGYCINIKKSVFHPTQTPLHLGYEINSREQCFRVTEDKKLKFKRLREKILNQKTVSVLDLQRLGGRAVSFMLAVPAAKLYTREINLSTSQGMAGNKIFVMGPLREELEHWRFLDSWEGKLKWKCERHVKLELFTDSSMYKYGVKVHLNNSTLTISDYWETRMQSMSIMVLEGHALLRVLQSVKKEISSCRVDAYVDNMVLLHAWEREGCRSRQVNDLIKQLFAFTLEVDIHLHLVYVPSKNNPADEPSRVLHKSDSKLSDHSWVLIQETFGGEKGHSIDLMSLDSNAMTGLNGMPLRHFTPYPTPYSHGINMFSQTISKEENAHLFPPFNLVLPCVRFVIENGLQASVVLPLDNVTPLWLPEILPYIVDAFILGHKGDTGVILVPSKRGYVSDMIGLPKNLWVIRLGNRSQDTFTWGIGMLRAQPSISMACHLIVVGDSMIRFLLGDPLLKNPMAHLFSVGGACIDELRKHVVHLAGTYAPKAIILHAGVNNLSKEHLYTSEFHQLDCAFKEFEYMETCLKTVQANSVTLGTNCQVVLSSISVTKNAFVNARAQLLNNRFNKSCTENNWLFLNNDNIKRRHLRDTVHWNDSGETLYRKSLVKVLRVICLGQGP